MGGLVGCNLRPWLGICLLIFNIRIVFCHQLKSSRLFCYASTVCHSVLTINPCHFFPVPHDRIDQGIPVLTKAVSTKEVVFKELGVLFVKHFYIVGLDVVSAASSGNILRRSIEQFDKSIVVVVGSR